MKGKATLIPKTLLFISMVFSGAAFLNVSPALAGDVMIVCNSNVPEDLSSQEIRDIYLGNKTMWPSGKTVFFVTLDDSDIHAEFLDMYVHKTPAQINKYWKTKIYTGRGKPPMEFDDPQKLMDYVSKTDGAIGYLPSDALEKSGAVGFSWNEPVQGLGSL